MLTIAGRSDVTIAAMRDRLPQTVVDARDAVPLRESRKFAVSTR
jgi:hypothetical protein